VPAGRQRPCFCLAVTDDTARARSRVRRLRESTPEHAFGAAFDNPDLLVASLGGGVTGDAAGERELAEKLTQPVLVPADVRVELAVSPLQVGVWVGIWNAAKRQCLFLRGDRRSAVTGAGDVDRAQLARADGPVQVCVNEVEAGRRAEVAEQPRLHMLGLQRLA
jgi:hypothetical protein